MRSDLTPTSSKEASITTTLGPSAYTAIVRGDNQSVRIGIVEAFEVSEPESGKTPGDDALVLPSPLSSCLDPS